jgi:hypothetical protein
MEEKNKF